MEWKELGKDPIRRIGARPYHNIDRDRKGLVNKGSGSLSG